MRQLGPAIIAPLTAFRMAYLPLLTVYLASGAIGIVAVADAFWVKQSLTLTPAELASLAVWLQLPWTAKMVVAEMVDGVALVGSHRRAWVLLGAGLIALGLVLMAGAAVGHVTFTAPERIYVASELLIVVGAVIQEVVVDAMSAEVVPRVGPDGAPRPAQEIDHELATVQVLARLVYSVGAFAVAWLAGVLAESLSYATVFLIGLVVPALSMAGVLFVRVDDRGASRPIDWRILGGGLALVSAAALVGLSGFRFAEETVFLVAMGVVVVMLRRVMAPVDPAFVARIWAVAVVIFAFRATPGLGDGYRWFTIDTLGFDERFFGVLQLTGTGVGLAAMWMLTKFIVGRAVRTVVLYLSLIAAVLWLPSLILVNGLHHWTEPTLGLGPRGIALIDEAAQSPIALVATVPLLTLIAVHAPARQRATAFALTASLMSLAIVAGQLVTKHLNLAFGIDRGAYDALPGMVAMVVVLSLAMPISALAVLWRRLEQMPTIGYRAPHPPLDGEGGIER
jgi:hypothetical protein